MENINLNFKSLWLSSWTTFKSTWKKIVPITIILGVFFVVLSLIQESVKEQGFLFFIVAIAGFVFRVLITLGFLGICLRAVRGQDFSWNDITEKSNKFFTYIGSSIVAGLYMVLSFVPSIVLFSIFATLTGTLSFIVLLLAIVLSVLSFWFVFTRLYFFQFFVVDNEMKIMDVIKTTWKSTRGKNLQVFLLILSLSAFNILGMLIFFVGLVITVPLSVLILANFYLSIYGNTKHDDSIIPEIRGEELEMPKN